MDGYQTDTKQPRQVFNVRGTMLEYVVGYLPLPPYDPRGGTFCRTILGQVDYLYSALLSHCGPRTHSTCLGILYLFFTRQAKISMFMPGKVVFVTTGWGIQTGGLVFLYLGNGATKNWLFSLDAKRHHYL